MGSFDVNTDGCVFANSCERLIPVNGVDEVYGVFKQFWGSRPLHRRPLTLIFTYGYEYDVIKDFAVLSKAVKVITGYENPSEG